MSHYRKVTGKLLLVGAVSMSTAVLADIQIKHAPVTQSSSGKRILLKSSIRNRDGEITDVRAYFKAADETRFYYVPMFGDDDQYSGLLPAPALGVGEVEYMIYAVGSDKLFVKTPRWTIAVKDDEEALERLRAKEPTDIEIDLDRMERLEDLAENEGEPDIERRVDVRTEIKSFPLPTSIPGFDDYIALGSGSVAAAGAGLAAATTVGVSAGISTPVLLGGVAAAVGGVAALSSGGGSSSPFNDPNATEFSWRSPSACADVSDLNYASRYVVALTNTGSDIGGNVYFHRCPGGGRVGYSVTGTLPASPPYIVTGTKTEGQGPVYGNATETFSLTPNQAPVPNLSN